LSVNVCCEPKLAFHPPKFDRHVLALDIAGFAEALAERGHIARVGIGRRMNSLVSSVITLLYRSAPSRR
jgi:hypothetical protein